ncbi:MAG: mannonate dehydratase [Propionibacteriaceae bacterium]|jgi:mannonate dehydratase|nr:mannonate dehydratase [Propionibacteriaceae bacterium]
MEPTFRWFGPSDPIGLEQIRQTGATGVVTALHEIPNGQVWPVEAIAQRRRQIEAAGLTWSVVESVPVPEDVKRGLAGSDRLLEAYCQTVRNLGAEGVDLICYNFMPVLDWTRTDLAHRLASGGWALRFDVIAFAAFDLFILDRPGAADDWPEADRAAARRLADGLSPSQRDQLTANVIAGLPGAEESYTLASLARDLAAYAAIGPDQLRGQLAHFLDRVAPVAEEAGVRLAIHPDDPPRPLLGLPRVVSTEADLAWLLAAQPSPANGLTFCTGSLAARPDNDLVQMARRFADRVHFVHLRSVQREADPRSFHEAEHIGGDVDLVGVVAELVAEELRRGQSGHRLPVRPDHGHQLLYDQDRRSNPGYSLIGRLKGLAEIRGVETAVRRFLTRPDSLPAGPDRLDRTA